MKTIVLLRHAKSDWGHSNLADIERPLAERGRRDAPEMGKWLQTQLSLDFALVSPATRAQQTFSSLGIEIPSLTLQTLYPTQSAHLLKALETQSDDIQNILVVGHNPGISHCLASFTSQTSGSHSRADIPTCACAILDFPQNQWREVKAGEAKLRAFMTPKQLREIAEAK